MGGFFKKAISITLTLAMILVTFSCSIVSTFAQETDSATISAVEPNVGFTHDSDIFVGSFLCVDTVTMNLSDSARFEWYKNGVLCSNAQSITFTQDDIDSEFYVKVFDGDAVYRSFVSTVVKKPDYYGYSKLSDIEKALYDTYYQGIINYQTTIVVNLPDKVFIDDLKKVNAILRADHPELFYYTGSLRYSYYSNDGSLAEIYPSYMLNGVDVTEEQILQAQLLVKNKVLYLMSQMYEELTIPTEYKKALWVHDKISELLIYKSTSNDQNIYGALVEQQAVCAGYSRLNQLMLNYAGIDAFTVTGASVSPTTNETIAHAWNLMWIDHHCLYTDVTWDDQKHHVFHLYFARTIDNMSINHFLDELSASLVPQGDEHCCEYNYFAYYHEDHAITADKNGEYDVKYIANLKDVKIEDKAWGIVVYDITGEDFMNWLNSDLNGKLNTILNNMNLSPGEYSISYLKIGGSTLGTEVHIYFEKNELKPPSNPTKYYGLGGSITSYANDDDVITVSLYKKGDDTPSQKKLLEGQNAEYIFQIINPGDYIIEVKKKNHLTFTQEIYIDDVILNDITMQLYGDCDMDNTVTVLDATLIQKYLAGLNEMNDLQKLIGDVNADDDLNIIDATKIQLHLAGLLEVLG